MLVVARQDARENIDTVWLVVEGRLGGEDQEMSTVTAPANVILAGGQEEGRLEGGCEGGMEER